MAVKTKNKPGRRFLPKGQAKAEIVPVRLQPGEKTLLEEVAKRDGLTVSDVIRRALKSVLDKAKVLL